jgi:hypothetical protein
MKAIILLLVFILITLGLLKLTQKEYKEGNASRTWKLFGGRAFYWQWVILISAVFTIGIAGVLKWTGIF